MTIRLTPILPLILFSCFAANAQELNAPPVTTFKPDTSLPKVSVPEFVITGKSQMDLPKTDKPGISIDSSYFQNEALQGNGIGVPLDRSLSSADVGNADGLTSLFAHLAYGHYSTADYLVSAGAALDGYLMNASIGGNYTSGFIPPTLARSFSIGGGASKDLVNDPTMNWRSALDVAYARSSYYLYGNLDPFVLRITNRYHVGLNSDILVRNTPFTFDLGYDKFSTSDFWENDEGTAKVLLATRVPVSSGNVLLQLDYASTTHSLSPAPSILLPGYTPFQTTGVINNLPYFLHVGGGYDNGFGNLSYSVALGYFQYSDDSTNGVAKLYPDLKVIYRFGDSLSIFARFYGSIDRASLESFVSADRFVNGYVPLVDGQRSADITLGSTISLVKDLAFIPQFNFKSERNFPLFTGVSPYNNVLMYAKKATEYKISLESKYSRGNLDAGLMLQFQKGKADSLDNLPNVPPFTADVNALYHLTPDLTVEGEYQFLSKRYIDLSLSSQVGAIDLLDMKFSYSFGISSVPFELFLEGKNLLNQRYYVWQDYQEFPLSLFIGVNCRLK